MATRGISAAEGAWGRLPRVWQAGILGVFVFLLRLPFLGPGYGADTDAWRFIRTAMIQANGGGYTPSRLPGYPLPEAIFSWAWSVHHHLPLVLTALASAAMVAIFILILHFFHARRGWLGGLALACTPVVFIASTSTMDYIWAMLFLLAAYYQGLRRRMVVSGILMGAAIGCRLTSAALVPAIGFVWMIRRDGDPEPSLDFSGGMIRFLNWGLLAGLVGAVCYLPVYQVFGWGFLDFYDTTRSWPLIMFKASVGCFGLLGSAGLVLVLFWMLVRARRGHPSPVGGETELSGSPWDRLVWWGGLATTLIMFLRLPLESGYLIPALPFGLLILGVHGTRGSFRSICLVLMASSFILTVLPCPGPDAKGPVPLISGTAAGRHWSLSLGGPVPADVWRRNWDVAKGQAVLAEMDRVRTPSLLAVGFDLPIVQVLNGGQLTRGQVEMTAFITREDLGYAGSRERHLLYLDGVQYWNMERTGFDLRGAGAELLRIPCK